MAAGRGRSLAMVLVLVAVAMFQSSEAATYIVGDAAGWSTPSAVNEDVYENWAMGKTFTVGDVLVFNFATGVHDVAQVSAQAADDCASVNVPIILRRGGPVNITLTTPGMNYFICTKPGHCNAGQELKINVLPAATGSGPVSSPGTTTPAGLFPANSASFTAASAGLFVAALATVAAHLY